MKVNNRGIFVNVREPILHWNNFTVPELKEILDHCQALEELGLAQDQKMMASIQRDIALREEKTPKQKAQLREQRKIKATATQEYLLAPAV